MSAQPEAGWYPMPGGGMRYWDGAAWSDIPAPPAAAAGPPPAHVPLLSAEEQTAKAYESAWSWAWLGLLLSPLGIVAVWKNVDARELGAKCGVEVGWGPTIMAVIVLSVSVLMFLFLMSGALG